MNIRIHILLFFAMMISLLSCKNKDYPLPTPPTTPLIIINAGIDTLNYYINGTRKNNVSSLYPGGATGYIPVPTGSQNYQFKKAGTANVLFTIPYTLDTGRFYSMFVTGETADDVFKIPDLLDTAAVKIAADTLFTLSVIRFVNASPDAGILDLSTTGSDTVSIKGYAFKQASPFITVKGGALKIKVNGSTTNIDTAFTLQVGGVYTLFTQGKLSGKGNAAFRIGLMTNGNY